MEFPSDWPAECPPSNAENANGDFYRIVKSCPPEDVDFLSLVELGRRFGKSKACQAHGLSGFTKLEDARHYITLFPKLGSKIAKGNLAEENGKLLVTPNSNSPRHHTWWPYKNVIRKMLFCCIS